MTRLPERKDQNHPCARPPRPSTASATLQLEDKLGLDLKPQKKEITDKIKEILTEMVSRRQKGCG